MEKEHGCKCKKATKYTLDDFHSIANKNDGKCLSEIENIQTKTILKFECKNGHIWETAARNILYNKSWCPKCNYGSKNDISTFQKIAIDKGGECLSTKFETGLTRLVFKCDKGHIWETNGYQILKGAWCHKCKFDLFVRKYTLDHDTFSKDTEEAFYIAGFLAADGNIKKDGRRLTISLALKDLEHLEKIKKAFKSTSPIKIINRFHEKICGIDRNKYYKSIVFSINSKQCCDDLKRFGVTPKKTYNLRFPEWLKTHPLVHHYIRGMIDGDGCFYLANGNEVDFCMNGVKEFLDVIHEIFLVNNITDKDRSRKPLEYKKGKEFAAFDILRYNGNGVLSRMYDFLYKDATIFLERKEEIARKSKEFNVKCLNKVINNNLIF